MAKYIDTISFCLYSPNEKDNGLPCRKFTLLIDELTFATLLRNICDNLNCSADDFFSQKYIITYGNRQGYTARLYITEDSFSEFLKFVHENKGDSISLMILCVTKSGETLETEDSKTQESSLLNGLISATDVEHLNAMSTGHKDNTQFMKLADFMKIFACRVNSENKNEMLEVMEQFIDNVVYDSPTLDRQQKYEECDFDESGFLKVKRLYDYQIADWLKKGAKILVPRNNNEYMLMQFTELEGRSKSDRGLVHWQRKGSAYECDEIKIPVNISRTAVKYDGYFNMVLIKKFEDILDNYTCQADENLQSAMKHSLRKEFQNYKQNQTRGLNKDNEEFRAWLNEYLIQFKELVIQEVKNSLVVSALSSGPDGVHNDKTNEVNAHSTNCSSLMKSSKDSESFLENVMNRLTLVEEHVYPLVDAIKSTSDMKPTASQSRFMETDYVSDFSNKAYFEEWVKDRAVIMLESDFYVISNTFRVKLPPNCSHSMKLLLVNRSRYRKSCEEVKLIPQVHGSAIEYNVEKNEELPRTPNSVWFSYHDICISSKNRCGKFVCFFKVMVNNKIINSDILIKVRVNKFYQIPEPDDVFYNKLDTRKSSSKKKLYSTKKSATGKKSRRWVTTSTPSMVSSDSEVSNIEETKRNFVMSDSSDDEIFTCVDKNSAEEDSSSSVSLMFDETLSKCEDRCQTVDKTDFVALPRCFLINTENNARDNVKIRVKRKTSTSTNVPLKTKNCPFLTANVAMNDVNMASSSHGVNSKKVINNNMEPNTSCLFPQPRTQFKCTATNTSSDSDSSLYTTGGANKMENVEQCEETPNKDEREDLFSATDMLNKRKNSSEGKDTQPLIIVPDKVFEMTNNVFKSVFNTIKPQSEGVKENVQKTFDETISLISQVVASCSAVPPPPPPTEFQTSTATVVQSEVPVSFTTSMCDNAASKTSSSSQNAESTEVVSSCSAVPPPTPLIEFPTITAPILQSEVPVSFTTSMCDTAASTSSAPLNAISTEDATEGASNYATKDATTPLQKQLHKLNEMGFKNEKYNLFLLIKYQHDMYKVVDCLLLSN